MKIHLQAAGSMAAGRLPIRAQDLRVTCGGKPVRSQWIAGEEDGLLLLELEEFLDKNTGNKRVALELEAMAVPATAVAEPQSVDGSSGAPIPPAAEHWLSAVANRRAFPDFAGVRFRDGVTGLVLPERETEPWAGKTYRLTDDPQPRVRCWRGSLAACAEVSAVCCDEAGNPAPKGATANYLWVFWRDLILVCARVRVAEGTYSYRFLAPELAGSVRYAAGEPWLEGPTAGTALGFDGFVAETDGTRWVGVYGASAQILPDGLTADAVGKECGSCGDERCAAWLYVGEDEARAKGLGRRGALPTDCGMRLVDESCDAEYSAGGVALRFSRTPGGAVWWAEGNGFISPRAEAPFWATTDRGEWSAAEGWRRVEFLESGVRFVGRADCLEAMAELTFTERERGWGVRLALSGPGLGRVRFPCLTVRGEGKVDLFVPSCAGRMEPDVQRRDCRYREAYAGPFANMSFLGPIDEEGRGFYACWEGAGERRDYDVESSLLDGGVRLSAWLWPENLGKTSRYESPVVALLGTQGGWRGMCREYRKFAETTPWFAEGRKPARSAMDENRLWLWSHFRWEDETGAPYDNDRSEAEWLAVIRAIDEKMRAKLGIMAYEWQTTLPLVYREDVYPRRRETQSGGATSDGISVRMEVTHSEIATNYMPHYLPAKPGFAGLVEELHRRDMLVIPYIDNRLWDPRDTLLGDFAQNWENTGRRLSAKDETGEPYMEYYCNHLPDGRPANSAVVCPHTEQWQDIMAETVIGLVKECGVDGVYLDQIAATAPALCMDETHGHPLGGGTWWREGYERMLAKMRAAVPDALLTTECEAEPYIAEHDAYLSWTHVLPHQVPAFTAVYSDRVRQYGRTPVCFGMDRPDVEHVSEVRAMYAQSYLFGEQLGFMFMRALLACGDGLLPFLDRLVSAREGLLEWFNRGELVDAPDLKSERELCFRWGRDLRPVVLGRVLAAVWRLGSEIRLLLVNPFDETGTAVWSPQTWAYGYGKKFVAETLFADSGDHAGAVADGGAANLPAGARAEFGAGEARFVLPPQSVVTLALREAD